jgi:hypothetical protein
MPPSESQLSIQSPSIPISPASGVDTPIPMDFISGATERVTTQWPHEESLRPLLDLLGFDAKM